jgi:probable glucitol transport protein GutA
MIPVLIIDNATYNEWKGNRRLESVGGGVVAFAASVGAGVAAALTGLVLGTTGYNGAHSAQTPQATAGIVALMSWIPALLSLTIIVFALGYFRLERRLPTITAEVEVIRSAALAREGMVPVTADASAGLAEGVAEAGRGAVEETRTDLEQDR